MQSRASGPVDAQRRRPYRAGMRTPLLLLLASCSLFACQRPAATVTETKSAAQPETAALVGKVDALVGLPIILRGTARPQVATGQQLFAGDQLQTPAGAKVRVALADGSLLAIGPQSQ